MLCGPENHGLRLETGELPLLPRVGAVWRLVDLFADGGPASIDTESQAAVYAGQFEGASRLQR